MKRANERDQVAAIASAEMRAALHRIAAEHGLTDWEFIRAASLAASEIVASVAKERLREERS